jgi:hypothetical protein
MAAGDVVGPPDSRYGHIESNSGLRGGYAPVASVLMARKTQTLIAEVIIAERRMKKEE